MYTRTLSFSSSRTSSKYANINLIPAFVHYPPCSPRRQSLYFTTDSTNPSPNSPQTDGQSPATPSGSQVISVLPHDPKTPSFARKPKPGSRTIWKSPIPPGKIPAYDEALKYIRADARKLSREAKELASVIKSKEAEANNVDGSPKEDPELEKLRQKLEILLIQSKINLPEVRFAFNMGKCTFLASIRVL